MSHSVAFDISGSIVRVSLSVRHTSDGLITTAEKVLVDFLKRVPLLSTPWTFTEQQKKRRIYCFLFGFSDIRKVLKLGIQFTGRFAKLSQQKFTTRILTMGSQAKVFEQELTNLLKEYNELTRFETDYPPLTAELMKRKELHCVRDALDYFRNNLATCLYRYKSTCRFITDSARSPVDTESEENGFPLYPYVLVNMKAGISFHLVTEDDGMKRLGGSPIGLATFLGLSQLFCGSDTSPYETFLKSDDGDQTKVDTLVSDIYGGDYNAIGLSGSMVASTMGKLQRIRVRESSNDGSPNKRDIDEFAIVNPFPSFPLEGEGSPRNHSIDSEKLEEQPPKMATIPIHSSERTATPFRPLGKEVIVEGLPVINILETDHHMTYRFSNRLTNETKEPKTIATRSQGGPCEIDHVVCKKDIYKSLLSMMSFNVAQLAYLNATLHKCKRIVLIGYYVDMPETLAAVQHCIQHWSKGQINVTFVRVAPYLGAIGAALEEARRCA